MGDVGRLGVAGIGAGFGLRSLIALLQQAGRNVAGPGPSANHSVRFVPPPIAMPPEEEEKFSAAEGMVDRLAKFIRGDYATKPGAIPWRMPAAVGAAGLGAYGGYRVADMLADRYYQSELDDEIKKERAAFEQALRGAPTSKLASAIDTLFETVKQSNVPDTLGYLAGLYGLYAGGAGLATGKYMFDKTMKGRRVNKINKAIKQRRMLLQQQRPTPIMVSDQDLEEEI